MNFLDKITNFGGLLNKIKYGAAIGYLVGLLQQFGLTVPTDVEEAMKGLVTSLVVLIPWGVAFFVKENKNTIKGLKLKVKKK